MKIACFSVALLATVLENRANAAEMDDDDLFTPMWLHQNMFEDDRQWNDSLSQGMHALALGDEDLAGEVRLGQIGHANLHKAVMASQTLAQPSEGAASDSQSAIASDSFGESGAEADDVVEEAAKIAEEITSDSKEIKDDKQEKKENKSNDKLNDTTLDKSGSQKLKDEVVKAIVKKNKDATDDAAAIESAVADKTVATPAGDDHFKRRVAHIARVSKYLKNQEQALATAEKEFQEKRAKAASALHAKMQELEKLTLKKIEEKLAAKKNKLSQEADKVDSVLTGAQTKTLSQSAVETANPESPANSAGSVTDKARIEQLKTEIAGLKGQLDAEPETKVAATRPIAQGQSQSSGSDSETENIKKEKKQADKEKEILDKQSNKIDEQIAEKAKSTNASDQNKVQELVKQKNATETAKSNVAQKQGDLAVKKAAKKGTHSHDKQAGMLDGLMSSMGMGEKKKKDPEHDKVNKTLESVKHGGKDKPPQISIGSLFGTAKQSLGHTVSVVSPDMGKSLGKTLDDMEESATGKKVTIKTDVKVELDQKQQNLSESEKEQRDLVKQSLKITQSISDLKNPTSDQGKKDLARLGKAKALNDKAQVETKIRIEKLKKSVETLKQKLNSSKDAAKTVNANGPANEKAKELKTKLNEKSKNDAQLAKLPIRIKALEDQLDREKKQGNSKAIKSTQAKLDSLVKELKKTAKTHDKLDNQIKKTKGKVEQKDQKSGATVAATNAKEIINVQQQLEKAKAKVVELSKLLEQKQQKNSDKHSAALTQALNQVAQLTANVESLSKTTEVTDANGTTKILAEVLSKGKELKEFKAPKPTASAQIISSSDDWMLAQVGSIESEPMERLRQQQHSNSNILRSKLLNLTESLARNLNQAKDISSQVPNSGAIKTAPTPVESKVEKEVLKKIEDEHKQSHLIDIENLDKEDAPSLEQMKQRALKPVMVRYAKLIKDRDEQKKQLKITHDKLKKQLETQWQQTLKKEREHRHTEMKKAERAMVETADIEAKKFEKDVTKTLKEKNDHELVMMKEKVKLESEKEARKIKTLELERENLLLKADLAKKSGNVSLPKKDSPVSSASVQKPVTSSPVKKSTKTVSAAQQKLVDIKVGGKAGKDGNYADMIANQLTGLAQIQSQEDKDEDEDEVVEPIKIVKEGGNPLPTKNGVSSPDSFSTKEKIRKQVAQAILVQVPEIVKAQTGSVKVEDDAKPDVVMKTQTDLQKETQKVIDPSQKPAVPDLALGPSQGEQPDRTVPNQQPRPPKDTPHENEVSKQSDQYKKPSTGKENDMGTGGTGLGSSNGFEPCPNTAAPTAPVAPQPAAPQPTQQALTQTDTQVDVDSKQKGNQIILQTNLAISNQERQHLIRVNGYDGAEKKVQTPEGIALDKERNLKILSFKGAVDPKKAKLKNPPPPPKDNVPKPKAPEPVAETKDIPKAARVSDKVLEQETTPEVIEEKIEADNTPDEPVEVEEEIITKPDSKPVTIEEQKIESKDDKPVQIQEQKIESKDEKPTQVTEEKTVA